LVTEALAIAEQHVGPLRGARAAVVGAGGMAALVATTLARTGASTVTVVNRTHGTAARLAAAVGGQVAPLSALPGLLSSCDVVLSCTGSVGHVIGADDVVAAGAGARDPPPGAGRPRAAPRRRAAARRPGRRRARGPGHARGAPRRGRRTARPRSPAPVPWSPTRSGCGAARSRRPPSPRPSSRSARRPTPWSPRSWAGCEAGWATWTRPSPRRSSGPSAASSTRSSTPRRCG
jgi:hypothetical protein